MKRAPAYQLAQVNVALTVAPFEALVLAGMLSRVDEINAQAEASPGFIWRFRNPAGLDWLAPFADFFSPFEPARIFFNMSVWESVEALQAFVFQTRHVDLLRVKSAWMLAAHRPSLALWWVPAGYRPEVREARERLEKIARDGLPPAAFDFRPGFPAPGA